MRRYSLLNACIDPVTDLAITDVSAGRQFDCSRMVFSKLTGEGDAMFSALYGLATLQGHTLGGTRHDALPYLRGDPVEDELAKAAQMRAAIVDFLRENKNADLPNGIVTRPKGRAPTRTTWYDFYKSVYAEEGESYEQHCDRLAKQGEWGGLIELRAANALGIVTKVVIGDGVWLRFRDPREKEETVYNEALLWHNKLSQGDTTANHYDLLMTVDVRSRLVHKFVFPQLSEEEFEALRRENEQKTGSEEEGVEEKLEESSSSSDSSVNVET